MPRMPKLPVRVDRNKIGEKGPSGRECQRRMGWDYTGSDHEPLVPALRRLFY